MRKLTDGMKTMGIGDFLKAMADGVFDGERTDRDSNGVSSGAYIAGGTPVEYRQGQSTKFFDGRENVRTPGKRTEKRFETEEEKTAFIQKYGYRRDMFGDHPEVMDYSNDFYNSKKKPKQS